MGGYIGSIAINITNRPHSFLSQCEYKSKRIAMIFFLIQIKEVIKIYLPTCATYACMVKCQLESSQYAKKKENRSEFIYCSHLFMESFALSKFHGWCLNLVKDVIPAHVL